MYFPFWVSTITTNIYQLFFQASKRSIISTKNGMTAPSHQKPDFRNLQEGDSAWKAPLFWRLSKTYENFKPKVIRKEMTTTSRSIRLGFHVLNEGFHGVTRKADSKWIQVRSLHRSWRKISDWSKADINLIFCWWFQTWLLFSIYEMSSFPLTFIFFRGVKTTNQWYFDEWKPMKYLKRTEDLQIDMGQNVEPFFRASIWWFQYVPVGRAPELRKTFIVFVGEISGMLNLPFTMMVPRYALVI